MNHLLAFSSRSILPRNEQKLLAVILMLGLFIRIIMVFVLHLPHMHKDSYEYYRQAAIMQQTGKFAIAGNARVNILYAVTACGSHIDFSMTDEHPEIDTKEKAERMYFNHMKKEPGEFIRQWLANAWELWGFYASDSDGHRSPLASIMLGACNVFLLGAGLFGWWVNRKNFMISILILPFLVVTVICVMLITIPRYGYPAEPFLVLTGAWTLVWLMRLVV